MTPSDAQNLLRQRGVNMDTLSSTIGSIAEGATSQVPTQDSVTDSLWIASAQCAQPQQSMATLCQLTETQEDVRGLLHETGAYADVVRFLDQGAYIVRAFQTEPWMLSDILAGVTSEHTHDEPRLVDVDVLESRLREHISRLRGDTMHAVRVFKRLESLRLFFYETTGRHSLSETAAGIADLAQACLHVCLDVASHDHGTPEMARELCFLGMGKLGGRELNYSSDVDIIAVCSDIVFANPERRRDAEVIVRRVISLMDENTVHGYVFRVDLRLRPEGAQGLLVQCPDAMLEYYLNWGRTWERSAMLKARTVAGNLEMGDALLEALEPFVYKKYLDYKAIDELRAMKEMVNQNAQLSAITGVRAEPEVVPPQETASTARTSRLQLAHRATRRRKSGKGLMSRLRQRAISQHPTADATDSAALASQPEMSAGAALGWDVKIGLGGIREIEFFVQALQLVHCGSRPGLRVKNTLDALNRLLYAGLIAHDDHNVLAQAYDFFRRVEHRVQMEHDRQTHRLPTTEEGFAQLATRLGLGSDALQQRIEQHRQQVSTIFGRLFHDSAQTSEEPTIQAPAREPLSVLLALEPDALLQQHVYDTLERSGFARGRQVAGQLRMLKQKAHGPFGRRASAPTQKLAAFLVQTCVSGANPDRAFSFIARLSTTVGDREWFWSMLAENPHATQLLVHVFGSSDYLSAMLLKDPNIVQDLLGVGSAQIERSSEHMRDALNHRLEGLVDLDHRRGRMQRFQQEEILRLSLHELGGAAHIEQTTRQLADLAELIIQSLLKDIYDYLRGQSGAWSWPSFVDLPFCVMGMGKLGGQELGFGSDLDVFFVYDDREDLELDHVFYAKLAQRFVRLISSAGQHGRLYEIDTRLRPSGQKGTLVVSCASLEDYYTTQASLWERQALIRARPLTGSLSLRRRLSMWRHQEAFSSPLPDDVLAQTKGMRETMREHLTPAQSVMDLKHGAGGLVDVEFLTQYLQWMAWRSSEDDDVSHHAPSALSVGVRSQHTGHALRALAAHPWVNATYPELDCDVLAEDYALLRRLEAILRVQDGRAQSALPAESAKRRELARQLRFHAEEGPDQFDAMLRRLFERNHIAWHAVFQ